MKKTTTLSHKPASDKRATKSLKLAAALLSAGVGAVALMHSQSAEAQSRASVQLDQFRPAETAEDNFAVSRPDDRGHGRLGAQLYIDYGMNPLVFESSRGDASTETTRVVSDQLVGHVGLSLGLFDRLVLFAGLPVNIIMDGSSTLPTGIPPRDSAGLSDVWAGARLRLFGERNDAFALALQATAAFPTAQATNSLQNYSGEQGVVISPELLAEIRFGGGWRLTANAGARLRAVGQGAIFSQTAGALNINQEFTFGGALTIPLYRNNWDVLTGHIEGYGATSFENFGARELTPFEAIAGLKLQPARGFFIGAAAGPGLGRGYGTPDLRVIGTLGFADPVPTEAPVEEREEAPGDRDRDGLNDNVDQCPDEPEDRDGFQDEDGCPDPDNDQDGILDTADACVNEPEDRDGFQDQDGCPDPDNDQDGILDATDRCPNEPEDHDGFEGEDGCPDPDNDQDAVLDVNDACPLDPGQPSANPRENGCPRTIRVDRESGTIIILQRVEFATNSDVVLDRSIPVLEEVRQVMSANPQIRRIRIEGHTDDRGRDSTNLELSRRRARSVMRWLRGHNIQDARVEAWGCGELHPRDSNRSNEGRQANRRVEFHIVDPAPPGGARHLEGCVQADD